MKRSTFNLALAASACLLVVVTSATAQVGDTRRASTSRAFGTCDGFQQEAILTNTQTSTATTSSSSFVLMPSTTIIDERGSGDGVDLYTVTLSGEASITGGGNYEVQAQVSIDGGAYINMYPNQPSVFHNSSAAQTHTMTWCREINADRARFRIVWRKNGGGNAYIDDYLMRVERSS